MQIRLLSTGETGTVTGPDLDGLYLLEFADGGTRVFSGSERVRVIPPGWDVAPPGGDPDDWKGAE